MNKVLIRYGKDFDLKKLSLTITSDKFHEEIKDIMTNFNELERSNRSFSTVKVPDNRQQIIKLLDEFIIVAKKYASVTVIYEKNVCVKCLSIVKCDCIVENNITKTKTDYEDESNFIKEIYRFQGKQSKKIDFANLTKELDNYFCQYSFPCSKDIKLMPLNEDCRTRGNTTIVKMIDALSGLKKPDLYQDINLICHEYWGWTLPDISDIFDQIIEDYRKTQKIYINLKKDRKSCLNLQYRLFKHLQVLGYPVKSEEFRIPTTDAILKYHDTLWKKMCEGCNMKFISTI